MLRFGKLGLVRLIKIPGGWRLKQASDTERGRERRRKTTTRSRRGGKKRKEIKINGASESNYHRKPDKNGFTFSHTKGT